MRNSTRDSDLRNSGQPLSFLRNPEREHVPRDARQAAKVPQSQRVEVVPICEAKAGEICLFPGIPKENIYREMQGKLRELPKVNRS